MGICTFESPQVKQSPANQQAELTVLILVKNATKLCPSMSYKKCYHRSWQICFGSQTKFEAAQWSTGVLNVHLEWFPAPRIWQRKLWACMFFVTFYSNSFLVKYVNDNIFHATVINHAAINNISNIYSMEGSAIWLIQAWARGWVTV